MSEMISLVAPVARDVIERWVEAQVDGLRGEADATGVCLGRFERAPSAQGLDWVVEIASRERDLPPEDDLALVSVLTHLERLGLQPQILVSSPALS